MKVKNIILLGIASLLGISYAVAAIDNSAEEVAWVVGDQPIWKSDIEEAYQSMLYEKTPINGDPYCVIPEQLAIEKLYLHQAELDTIEVSESMVMQQVEMTINNYIAQLGSQEKVEQMFNKPLPAIRETLHDMISNRSRVQQVQQSLVKDVKATPSDVRRYFDKLPEDSIPYVPRKVEVQILTAAPAIPREEIDNVKATSRLSPSFTVRTPARPHEAASSALQAAPPMCLNLLPWPSTSTILKRCRRLSRPNMATT